MAGKKLNKIFLSASIPTQDRDPVFYETADIIAIRDAVRALATVVIPRAILIWGGHPAITPLIRFVMEKMDVDMKTHVTIYQSEFFKDFFPPDNFDFENIQLVPIIGHRDTSLEAMRRVMISDNQFAAGVFIGGMEGIFEEYKLFKNYHPNAIVLPIGSTGGAAKMLFDEIEPQPSKAFLQNFAYMDLFQEMLGEYI